LVLGFAKTENHRLIKSEKTRIHPVEDSLYGTQSWTTYAFKARQPLKKAGGEKYYFAYSASVLSFGDTAQAARRLDSVRAYYLPEDRMMKKTQYGFRLGSQVVFLSVHPVLFEEPLRKLADTYRRKAHVTVLPE
jgi:hypothetical protein